MAVGGGRSVDNTPSLACETGVAARAVFGLVLFSLMMSPRAHSHDSFALCNWLLMHCQPQVIRAASLLRNQPAPTVLPLAHEAGPI
jgi:hypothetical protein